MKQPRIEDFDPNAKTRTLKSSLDNMPSIEKHVETQVSSFKNTPEQKSSLGKPTLHIVPPVLPVPPVKRQMKQRHPFDIYQDQYESLLQLAKEDRKNGGFGSMSAMVRQALDEYISKSSK